MKKLSVVISAYNEEKKIGDCLKSVQFADEIIVIDNESADRTVSIAKKHGAKVYSKPNNLMLNINKNYGFTKATGEWILNLDADERVTQNLEQQIKTAISNGSKEILGFWIPRKNIIFGKWIQHTGWYPDLQLRLFKKTAGKFPGKHVHEMIFVDGETDSLTESMLHENYQTIMQFLHKHMVIYAPNEAEQLLEKNYQFNFMDCIRMPVKEFISRYFSREGYKDGFHGLMLSLLMAFYHLMIFANIWEIKNFADVEHEDFLNSAEDELKKAGVELKYWFTNEKIKQTKNLGKKLWLKAKRKLSV